GDPATALWTTATRAAPGRDDEPTQIVRHQLQGPALGLLLAGIADCLWGLFCLLFVWLIVEDFGHFYGLLPWGGVTLFQGTIIIGGAWKMRKLEAYEFVYLAILLTLLPIAPSVIVGLVFGIWALVMLRKPEVIAAFKIQTARVATSRPVTDLRGLRRFFTST